MTDFYVYVHRKATTGEIFYVGKGCGKRAYAVGVDRSVHWNRLVKKHGHTIELVASGLQEWYAHELERELIAYHGRKNLGLGPLINKTDGGEGVSGLVFTQESLKRLSDSHLGWVASEDTRAKMSASFTPARKAKLSADNKGKTLPPERVARMSEAARVSLERPEVRKKMSDGVKAAYASPEARQRLSASAKAACATPEARKVKSDVAKAAWASPEHRERVSLIQRMRWAERKARA